MSREQVYRHLVSGKSRGAGASVARGVLAAMSPAYAVAVRLRNAGFDRGWRQVHELPRPVISVGNLTVGGTGKTPVVAWLCARLAGEGHRPAVLMRGYKAAPGEKGDEQRLLESMLGPDVPVEANPDRVAGALAVLERRPDVSLFLLDDGFQHRRVRRDFDLVLIDATCPFGHGRVLPRGLLREPVAGLRRASAVLITRSGLAGTDQVAEVQRTIATHTSAPVFTSDFTAARLRDAAGGESALPEAPLMPVCAIGNPEAFVATVRSLGTRTVEPQVFADHHHYTDGDVARIRADADGAGAAVVTTGKDWVKLRDLWPGDATPAIYVIDQQVSLSAEDEAGLLARIVAAVSKSGGPAAG